MQYENFITYHLVATAFELRLEQPKMAPKRCFLAWKKYWSMKNASKYN